MSFFKLFAIREISANLKVVASQIDDLLLPLCTCTEAYSEQVPLSPALSIMTRDGPVAFPGTANLQLDHP